VKIDFDTTFLPVHVRFWTQKRLIAEQKVAF